MDGSPSLAIAREALANALFIPVEKILPSTLITDLKSLDSLTFEGLVLELERLSGAIFAPEDFLNVRTVSDLARIVELRRPVDE